MIPAYPECTKISKGLKEEMEMFLRDYYAFSEFTFTCLWCWDIDNTLEVATLNNNLVIKFNGVFKLANAVTFLGTRKINMTMEKLLSFEPGSIRPSIRILPDVFNIAEQLSPAYSLSEEEDFLDYVYLVKDLKRFPGKKFRRKRNLLNKFKRSYNSQTAEIDLKKPRVKKEVLDLFLQWRIQKGQSYKDDDEYKAISKLLASVDFLPVRAIGVYVEGNLIGFAIFEVVRTHWSFVHFEKADNRYAGIWQFLKNEVAKALVAEDCKYVNYEPDLGIEGLRISKLSYQPRFMLKKFSVRYASK